MNEQRPEHGLPFQEAFTSAETDPDAAAIPQNDPDWRPLTVSRRSELLVEDGIRKHVAWNGYWHGDKWGKLYRCKQRKR